MKTSFAVEEIPEELRITMVGGDEELRCPQWDDKKKKVCNRKFCDGRASPEPQKFKCPRCGKFTTFKRLS